MKKLLLIALVLLAVFTLTRSERYSWRQKLTITIETPAGEVSAASVSQVSWRKHWVKTDGMGWDYELTGEAVVVEVTPGHYLFALLKGAGVTEYMGTVAAASIVGRKGRVIDGALFDEVRDRNDRAAGVITVPEYQYPMLVTFADITDPASVELIDPADLAASFGPGVKLKSVVLEVTDEAVTKPILDGLLGWLGPFPEPALGPATGGSGSVPFYRLVHMGYFLRRPE
ncbi:hypothetical protein [Cypionkella sp. TWP1-2-1b2]|uniref:hypothetical protein n=1 Tax=Cypionkella sp. TWP1-2-1b2 TaxID=2804675 RepID=UPI003CF52192